MRRIIHPVLSRGRLRHGALATADCDGLCDAFKIIGPCNQILRIIASDGRDWMEAGLDGQAFEHVSVSLSNRTPNWREMCFVKDLFWSEEECVIQYHPPRSMYVNHHPNCLHLWKPIGFDIPMPSPLAVGPLDDDAAAAD